MESTTPVNEVLPVVFLPGAGGKSSFWKPVADRLWRIGPAIVLGYPGMGDVPTDTGIETLEDYYEILLKILPPRFHLIAQSMGNVLALRIALEQPSRVQKLVLCAVTGGIDVLSLGGENWRESFLQEFPKHPRWYFDDTTDFSTQLSQIACPTLILSGANDPLSPQAVAEFLKTEIPDSRHVTVESGTHSMAIDQPDIIATEIRSFLSPFG